MRPSLSLAACARSGSPRPTRRVVLLVKNGSSALSLVSASMPFPLSPISIDSRSRSVSSVISIETLVADAAIAFSTMSRT